MKSLAEELAQTLFIQRKKPRVLLVEDNDDDAELTSIELRRLGCEIVRVRNANKAIEAVGNAGIECRQFDTAIIDLFLMGIGMSGLELAKQLRVAYQEINIDLYSGAFHDQPIVFEAMAQGFPVIPKPYRACHFKQVSKQSALQHV